jgi:hypothetical protein
MQAFLSRGLLIALALSLCSCATHEVTPVAMVQPGDDALSCAGVKQQIADDRTAQAEYQRKDKQVEAGNVAKNVGAVIPFVGIALVASTDLSNEEQVKARALADRIERLDYLSKQKGCGE